MKLKLLELFGPGWPGARPEGDNPDRTKVPQPINQGGLTFPYEEDDGEDTLQDDEIKKELQLELKYWGSHGEQPIYQRPGYDIKMKGNTTGDASVVKVHNPKGERALPISMDQPGNPASEELESFDDWVSGAEEQREKGILPTLGEMFDLRESTRGARGLTYDDGSTPIVTADPWAGAGVPHQASTKSFFDKKKREKEEAEADVGLSLEGALKKLYKEYADTDWSRGSQQRISRSDLEFFERAGEENPFLMNTTEEFEQNQKGLNDGEDDEE